MVIPAAADLLQQRANVLSSLKEHLEKAQNRMKFFADRKRSDREFQVGDWSQAPTLQTTISGHSQLSQAILQILWHFKILERVGQVFSSSPHPCHLMRYSR